MYVFSIGLTLTIWKKKHTGEIQEPELEDDIPDTESIAEHKVKRISAEEVVQDEFCINLLLKFVGTYLSATWKYLFTSWV